jgi:diguanylate cyclase (GGDEF)-like protein/PAS domain S-box-containing protein/excisionase family DNA binding protein
MPEEKLEYSIQEVAEKLGIPIQKLRRWDAQGVLVARRTEGGHRRYPKDMVDGLVASLPGQTEMQDDGLAQARKGLRERRRLVQLLREAETRYRDLIEISQEVVWSTDARGCITQLAGGAEVFPQVYLATALGRHWRNFEDPAAQWPHRRFIARLRRDGEVRGFTLAIRDAEGQRHWLRINARLIRDASGAIQAARGTALDVTELGLHEARVRDLEYHDALTGLGNRPAFMHAVERAVSACSPLAVVLVDVDRFAMVNDEIGWRHGDHLLVAMARTVHTVATTHEGTAFRIGADEFALLLPGATDEVAAAVAADLVHHLPDSAAGAAVGPSGRLTASAGFALFPAQAEDADALLAAVDGALRQARAAGGNRASGVARSPAVRAGSGRQGWGQLLREVLRRDGLRLYVQPVVRVDDGAPVHYEVLVRAEAADGTLLSPEQFIGPAESLGLVQEIDLAVIRKLLDWLDEPERHGLRCRFFVNVSAVSISDPGWLTRFQSLLDGSGFTPGQVVFELSEAAAMAHMPASQAFARDIKRRGCRLAIDDFGAGFGSFQSLRDLPVDYVNIDGGFIRHMAQDDSGAILLRALGDVGRGLSRQVIAKWVETPEVLSRLGALDVHYAQGFLFGRPVPIDSPLPGGRYFPSPGQAAPH